MLERRGPLIGVLGIPPTRPMGSYIFRGHRFKRMTFHASLSSPHRDGIFTVANTTTSLKRSVAGGCQRDLWIGPE